MRYSSDPTDRICLALDVSSLETAARVLDPLLDAGLKWVKWGYELIYAPGGGPSAIAEMAALRSLSPTSILDAKLDDTPTSVAGAVRGIHQNGFRYYTGHLNPARPSVTAMVENQQSSQGIGVSVLTSLDEDDLREIGYGQDPAILQIVRMRIEMGLSAGLTRFVCSPLELFRFRQLELFEDVDFLVPGVRPQGAPAHGQKRIATPKEVLDADAWLAVMGSPILRPEKGTSPDAFKRICDEAA